MILIIIKRLDYNKNYLVFVFLDIKILLYFLEFSVQSKKIHIYNVRMKVIVRVSTIEFMKIQKLYVFENVRIVDKNLDFDVIFFEFVNFFKIIRLQLLCYKKRQLFWFIFFFVLNTKISVRDIIFFSRYLIHFQISKMIEKRQKCV